MKRGNRAGSTLKIDVGIDGRPLNEEDLLFRKKNVDFTKTRFPEVNFLNYKRKDVKSSRDLHI